MYLKNFHTHDNLEMPKVTVFIWKDIVSWVPKAPVQH